jgi:putative ABC transport system permease protein
MSLFFEMNYLKLKETMNIYTNFIESLESLYANKLRSALTILGIVIGVAAVIAMLSIGKGAQQSITSQIESIGTNLVYVSPGSVSTNGVASAPGSASTLTQDDATAIAELSNVVAVAPVVEDRAQVVYMGNNTNTRLLGVTQDYQTALNMTMAEGDFISDANVTARSSVVVLGSSVATTLFGDAVSAVDQNIRINSLTFRVVGVLTSKGGTGFMNQDDQIFVPLTTAQTRLVGNPTYRGGKSVSTINVMVDSTDNVTSVEKDITSLLEERHNVQPGADDFTITSQQDTLAAATSVTNTLSIFLGGIAGISLLVGGIGIMNIMLTTVTERTHEIGLRKAIGARRSDILMQFMVEAVSLSLLGGILGVILGWSIAQAIGGITIGGSAITPVVTLSSVLMATLFSLIVGLFFGIYPAARAAGLQPVEALRYE